MHSQLFAAIGALLYLATTVSGVPALQFSDTEEYCGVTTIYVTISPTSSTTATLQLSKTPTGEYGRISGPFPAASTESSVFGAIIGSSIGVGNTSTTQLTSTVHQTVWLTNYMTGSGTTRTETVEITYPIPLSITSSTFTQTAAGETSTSSGGVLIASISSVAVAQTTSTAYGGNDYPTIILKTQQECSGDLIVCSKTSVLHSLTSSSVQNEVFTQSTSSTSATSEVYIFETLTVIPLESILSISSSFVMPIGLTTQSGATSTITVTPMSEVVSIPTLTGILSSTASPNTALGSSFLSRVSSGSGGWNISIASSSVNKSLAVGTAFSTILDVAALSTGRPSTPSVSSEFINFSNSYLFPNMTSTLAAEPGFTIPIASLPSSFSSASVGSSSFEGAQSLVSTSSSLPAATGIYWTESCSETTSSSSVVDALRSTAIGFTASTVVTTSSPASPSTTTLISAVTWNESCIENNSSTSTANVEQYTLASATGGSSIGLPLIVSSSTNTFWNNTTSSSSASLNIFVSSSSSISIASSAQSAFSSFTASMLSSYSSATLRYSLKNSYSLTTATSNMTATPSLATSFFSTISNSPISSGTSEASPLNTTSSSLPTSSPSSTFETSQETTSLLFLATPALTTSLPSTTTGAISPAEDTCTGSAALPPSFTALSTPTSSVLTFITIASSATLTTPSSDSLVGSTTALTATSTSSSSQAPSLCGEYGAFTLNFDDLPPLSVKDNATADPMPLFSPYHQFYFSDGWTIVPPPTDPYLPSSPPLLVEFLADPDSALGYTGAVGNGENSLLGCFNFNVLGMSLGCDSKGPDCDWQFTGLRYNNITKGTDTITSQIMSTAACVALANCTLVPIVLDGTFQNLTEFRINVTVSGVEKIWWLDDLSLSWFDDSCNAGSCRAQQV